MKKRQRPIQSNLKSLGAHTLQRENNPSAQGNDARNVSTLRVSLTTKITVLPLVKLAFDSTPQATPVHFLVRRLQSTETISPADRVTIALSVSWSIVSDKKRTEPSARPTFAPELWKLKIPVALVSLMA